MYVRLYKTRYESGLATSKLVRGWNVCPNPEMNGLSWIMWLIWKFVRRTYNDMGSKRPNTGYWDAISNGWNKILLTLIGFQPLMHIIAKMDNFYALLHSICLIVYRVYSGQNISYPASKASPCEWVYWLILLTERAPNGYFCNKI